MKTSDLQSGSQERTALLGTHLGTFEALFRHPMAHNLEWKDVVALMERIGAVHEKGHNKVDFELGGEHLVIPKPHTKDLPVAELVALRHLLQRAGWAPDAKPQARPSEPAAPALMVVLDHHGARIYRIDAASADSSGREIRPYDPHHFLHHLTHRDQLRERGQRAPEEAAFYQQIAVALASAERIIVVGHGTGKSNAAEHLLEYLRAHHRETYQRVVREIGIDLSAITMPQLLALAEQALGSAP